MNSLTLFFFFIPFLAFLLIMLNIVLAPHKPYSEKDSAFECGFHSFLGQNRSQFSISFFLFGLLFLIFDLEIVLIFPYGVSLNSNLAYGLSIVFIFIVILTAGFIFEIGKKALTINSKQSANILIGLRLILNSDYNLIKIRDNRLLNLNNRLLYKLLIKNNKLSTKKSKVNHEKFQFKKFINKLLLFLSRVIVIVLVSRFIKFLFSNLFEVDVSTDLSDPITIVYYPLITIIGKYVIYLFKNHNNYWKLYLFWLFILFLNLIIIDYNLLEQTEDYIILSIFFIKKKKL